jgi:hypothetical protein
MRDMLHAAAVLNMLDSPAFVRLAGALQLAPQKYILLRNSDPSPSVPRLSVRNRTFLLLEFVLPDEPDS